MAWALYDWANSAYSTLSITVLMLHLFKVFDVVKPGLGQMIWGWGIGTTAFVAALLSPVLGAIADAGASKGRWLAGTALSGAVASMLMFFTTPDRPWLLLALFLISYLAMELSQGFYNAFLPEISDDQSMGRVSAFGYALGYLGGGIALALVIGLLLLGDRLGLPSADGFRFRLALLFMGAWWGVFTLPAIFLLHDRQPPSGVSHSLASATKKAFREVRHTLVHLRSFRALALFLLGFLVFNDGVQTVISQAGAFASTALSMSDSELVQVVLMIQFLALPGALAVGRLAERIGQKRTLDLCLGIWIALLTAALFINTRGQFWVMAGVAALVLGGTQSVSRTMMGLMTPPKHAGEFFGFFNLSGKATSIFGPTVYSTIYFVTENAHLAIGSLLVFFIVGWIIVSFVDLAAGQRQAAET